MFQNSYQNGTYFDLLDPKGSRRIDSAQADKLKQLYRTNNPNINHKIFDKELKSNHPVTQPSCSSSWLLTPN